MAKLRCSWRALRALTWAERRLLVGAWLLLPLAAAALRLLGFRRTQALLLRPAAAAPRQDDLPAAQAVARIVLGAAGWSPVPLSCLARSLALCRLVHSQGLAADLRIGVAQPDGRFAAHAWVEHAGVALAEAETVGERYAAFDATLLTGGSNAP